MLSNVLIVTLRSSGTYFIPKLLYQPDMQLPESLFCKLSNAVFQVRHKLWVVLVCGSSIFGININRSDTQLH